MKTKRWIYAAAFGASLAMPSCFFDVDDDDDGSDADTCLVRCDDDHTECTTACVDDSCVTACDDVRTDCEATCS